MGQIDFVRDMERFYQSHPMSRESFEKTVFHQVRRVHIYISKDPYHIASYMRFSSNDVTVFLNAAHPDIETNFIHEVAHAFYDRRMNSLFRKYKDDESVQINYLLLDRCEEDLLDEAAEKFCKENPGFAKDLLRDILSGQYPQIEVDHFWPNHEG